MLRAAIPVATAVGLSASGCTNAELAPIPLPEVARADNKVAIEGRFCTTDPDDLAFPVKILFMIDISSSMDTTDPEARRVEALLEVIDSVKDIDGVEIAIVGFGLGTNRLTGDGATFVSPEEALLAAPGAAGAAGTTDFVNALNSVISLLAEDMAGSDATALQNARYSIIMLSDGLPDSDGTFDPIGICRDAAAWEQAGKAIPNAGVVSDVGTLLNQIGDLAKQYDVRELTFNTAFAAAPETQTQIKACGATFMRAMSKQQILEGSGRDQQEAPGGVFRDFSSGEEINFLFVDFTSFKRVFAMNSFLVTNLNAAPFSHAIGIGPRVRSDDPTLALGIIDSDGDGLTDEIEDKIGTDPRSQDSDGDGFSDLLENRLVLSGSDPLDPTDADCAADIDRLDTDGDGLRDCEERFFGTGVTTYDTDNDGFGDGVEVLANLNPNLDDTFQDVDFDGVRNNNEMRAHSSVDQEDVLELSEHAYRYKVVEDGLEGSSLCYTFRTENIALASTHGADAVLPVREGGVPAAAGLGGGATNPSDNRIILEVTEQPFDSNDQQGVARLACAVARFNADEQLKDPANGLITLTPDAFKPANEFDPLVDCVLPE